MTLTLAACLLLWIATVYSLTTYPIVKTSYGSIRGYEYTTKGGFTGQIYKKLPYAKPPTGDRRWRRVERPDPWKETIDGTFFGPACAQRTPFYDGPVTGFSEDCLHVHIYTSEQCIMSNGSCPVVFYIHGGNVLFDGPMMFPDEAVVTNFASQGTIIATTTYRLGVFGTMALGDENAVPANLALHDTLDSLRFVRQEIHKFGGDKDKITVMGHSSGALMVLMIAFSPGITTKQDPHLFSSIIAMSGSVNLESEEKQITRSHSVAKSLGCKDGAAEAIIACMRNKTTEEILSKTSKSFATLKGITMAGELMPIRNVKEMWENPPKIRMMLGTTLNEFEGNSRKNESKSHTVESNDVNKILGIVNDEECNNKYFIDTRMGKFDPRYGTVSQAIFMTNWMYAYADAQDGADVYLYQYDYPKNSKHTDDLSYILGFHTHETDINEEWLSRVYPRYFTNFIRGNRPVLDWYSVKPNLMNYYSINKSLTEDVQPHMKFGYHHSIADYYVDYMKYDGGLTQFKQKILNLPVHYKSFNVTSGIGEFFDAMTTVDYIIFVVVIIVVLSVIIGLCNCIRKSCCKKKSVERHPLLAQNFQ